MHFVIFKSNFADPQHIPQISSADKECANNLQVHNSDGDDSDHSCSSGSSVGEHLKNAMLNHSAVAPLLVGGGSGLHHAQPVSVVKPIPLLGHRLNRDARISRLTET